MIIYTDDTNVWEQVIRQSYYQHKQTTVTLQGDHQIFIKDTDGSALFVAVSIYHQANEDEMVRLIKLGVNVYIYNNKLLQNLSYNIKYITLE